MTATTLPPRQPQQHQYQQQQLRANNKEVAWIKVLTTTAGPWPLTIVNNAKKANQKSHRKEILSKPPVTHNCTPGRGSCYKQKHLFAVG